MITRSSVDALRNSPAHDADREECESTAARTACLRHVRWRTDEGWNVGRLSVLRINDNICGWRADGLKC